MAVNLNSTLSWKAALKAGVDGLAVDPSGEWVWFAAMNHDTMYRVRAADLKDASLAFGDRATCVAVHPGWVQTDMGGSAADLTVEQSVASLRALIGRLGPQDTGRFLDHDGTNIPW